MTSGPSLRTAVWAGVEQGVYGKGATVGRLHYVLETVPALEVAGLNGLAIVVCSALGCILK